ncbi:MAG TPA: DUF4142 domain-containing protein [Bryobacteraceae bacterium]|jgi:putative membrane protein|nr:DUF4142 domain-containing protein [Bryobacteraceae bacterium]
MKPIVRGFLCLAVLSPLMLAQKKPAAAALSPQEFVDMAAQTDMTEAHLGQMAADQAGSQAVKDYAQTLVQDHTADYNQITAVATKAGLTVPKGLDAKHEKMIAPFEKLKGAAFDRKYAHEMIAGHTEAIAAYKKESEDGTNADVKAYATQTLPTLDKHLSGAKDLMKAGK